MLYSEMSDVPLSVTKCARWGCLCWLPVACKIPSSHLNLLHVATRNCHYGVKPCGISFHSAPFPFISNVTQSTLFASLLSHTVQPCVAKHCHSVATKIPLHCRLMLFSCKSWCRRCSSGGMKGLRVLHAPCGAPWDRGTSAGPAQRPLSRVSGLPGASKEPLASAAKLCKDVLCTAGAGESRDWGLLVAMGGKGGWDGADHPRRGTADGWTRRSPSPGPTAVPWRVGAGMRVVAGVRWSARPGESPCWSWFVVGFGFSFRWFLAYSCSSPPFFWADTKLFIFVFSRLFKRFPLPIVCAMVFCYV